MFAIGVLYLMLIGEGEGNLMNGVVWNILVGMVVSDFQ